MNTTTSRGTFDILALLTPYDIDLAKTQVGPGGDGSYVLADLPGTPDILSFGVSTNVSFEKTMARKGHRSFMFDHTITALPEEDPLFRWEPIGIIAEHAPSENMLPLRQHVERLPDLSERAILKIDVEGYEWGIFATLQPHGLSRFDQIVVELHWLRLLDQPNHAAVIKETLMKLSAEFTLFHVHGNNCAGMHFVHGLAVADVIEASYVRTSLVRRSASRTVYPTPMDRPNDPNKPDLPLLFFPFLPLGVDQHALSDVIARISAIP